MKSPITRSCMRSVLEKQIVRRTKRVIRVRKVVLRIYWISASLVGQLASKYTTHRQRALDVGARMSDNNCG